MDVQMQCSSEVLDPSIRKVFKPTRKDGEVCTMSRTPHSHVLLDANLGIVMKRKIYTFDNLPFHKNQFSFGIYFRIELDCILEMFLCSY